MYIKILLSLSILSCTDKKIDINTHKTNKKETIQSEIKKKRGSWFFNTK